MVASSSSKCRSLISNFFICVSTNKATSDLILRSSSAAKCFALTAAEASAAAAAVCILFSLKAPPAPSLVDALPLLVSLLPSLVSPSPLLSSVLISTSLVVPVSVGEELEADLFEALLVLSILLALSEDDSLDFLSMVLLIVGVLLIAVVVVVDVVDDDVEVDVELESVFVLSLSDFVLSFDLASSVACCV